MRIIYEPNIEKEDFLEVILTFCEYKKLVTEGVTEEFLGGFSGVRNLNIFIRIQDEQGQLMPTKKGKNNGQKKITRKD